jgi:hypothetical protein
MFRFPALLPDMVYAAVSAQRNVAMEKKDERKVEVAIEDAGRQTRNTRHTLKWSTCRWFHFTASTSALIHRYINIDECGNDRK